MDFFDTLTRSLEALDRSRNRRQATVLLNYHAVELMEKTKLSLVQTARRWQALRNASDELVSRSFSLIARSGDVLERWQAPDATSQAPPVQMRGKGVARSRPASKASKAA